MKAAITILGFAGWGAAIALIVLLRDARVPEPLVFGDNATVGERVRLLGGRASGAMAGCILAGVLVMGLGSRLMMRVLAATSPETAQGAITDMDAVVGEVTAGGTVGLVVFVGVGAGAIGWVVRLVVRRWLPKRAISAGLVGAAIGAGLVARGSALLDPANPDFEILTPDWLAVVLIVGLIVTFGMALTVLSDRLAAWWPVPDRGSRAFWFSPLALLILVPPIAAVLGVGTVLYAWVSSPERSAGLERFDRTGRTVVLIAAAAGGAWTLAAAAEILTAG